MTTELEALAAQVADSGRPCLAVSPHLDDAVLSAGAWLSRLATQVPVTVATVFSAAQPPPHSWIARRFVRGCGHTDAESLFTARRAEDRSVLGELGLAAVHLDLTDAVFRRTPFGPWSRPVYPTLRFDALRGRIARSDGPVRAAVTEQVKRLIAQHRPSLVVAPLGIGRHVDHLIVRDAVRRVAALAQAAARTGAPGRADPGTGFGVVYASDQPYALSAAPDPSFVRDLGLHCRSWSAGREQVVRAAAGYRSQVRVLYPGGFIAISPEFIWT